MTTILIVEDDPILLETLAYNVEQEGYLPLTAEDGSAGLSLIKTRLPDLVILDVMLPGLDGLAVCRMARRDPATAHIPIILLTARGMSGDKMAGLDSGADDYVTKPFDVGELLARIRAVLRRSASPSAAASTDILDGGAIRLDLAARKAYRDSSQLDLTAKEFDLLAVLIRHQGRALSRDLILSRVWGDPFIGDPHTLDVHIRWLRQKIEDDPAAPNRIQTVRGIGYRYEV